MGRKKTIQQSQPASSHWTFSDGLAHADFPGSCFIDAAVVFVVAIVVCAALDLILSTLRLARHWQA